MKKKSVICLMGPTASGKTDLAIKLAQQLPCEIISVDSAMVYRALNIGTAKPAIEILQKIPHHLIDIFDPSMSYSAGQFQKDAQQAIENILARDKVPLLVGGTMLYYRTLQQGIASLPPANPSVRQVLQAKFMREGTTSLYAELQLVDGEAAKRIAVNDQQRIQRALEVFYTSGVPISHWQKNTTFTLPYHFSNIVIVPERACLHERIEARFDAMLTAGFIDEVARLYNRGDLSAELPSIRTVGYRQAWLYLAGEMTFEQMRERSIIATRQLAKRQMTWLRHWPETNCFESSQTAYDFICQHVVGKNVL